MVDIFGNDIMDIFEINVGARKLRKPIPSLSNPIEFDGIKK
jgi:hypothetical protein